MDALINTIGGVWLLSEHGIRSWSAAAQSDTPVAGCFNDAGQSIYFIKPNLSIYRVPGPDGGEPYVETLSVNCVGAIGGIALNCQLLQEEIYWTNIENRSIDYRDKTGAVHQLLFEAGKALGCIRMLSGGKNRMLFWLDAADNGSLWAHEIGRSKRKRLIAKDLGNAVGFGVWDKETLFIANQNGQKIEQVRVRDGKRNLWRNTAPNTPTQIDAHCDVGVIWHQGKGTRPDQNQICFCSYTDVASIQKDVVMTGARVSSLTLCVWARDRRSKAGKADNNHQRHRKAR
jgi:hypothetical protein